MTEFFIVRSCCRSPTVSIPIKEPAAPPEGWTSQCNGEVIEVIAADPPPPDPMIAAHEASHAVILHGFGVLLGSIHVGAINQVRKAKGARELGPQERAIVSLSGDIGANWATRRWVVRPSNGELLERVSALKLVEIGGCDQCKALLQVHSLVGGSAAPAAAYMDAYRRLEEATLGIVQRFDVLRAIKCVSAALMASGELGGEAAHALIQDSGLPFNSFDIPSRQEREGT